MEKRAEKKKAAAGAGRVRSPSAGEEDEFIVEQVGTLTKAKLYAPGRGGLGEGSGYHLLEKMSS